MLSSISPFGERARASRWWVTATAYVLSSTLGGAALGALMAALGGLVPESVRSSRPAVLSLAILVIVGLLLDLQVAGRGLPSWRRQVDEAWLGRYRGWVVGVGFGSQLGFGLVTIITSATTYAAALLAAWSGSWVHGLAIGVTFGLVRALPLLAMAGVHTPAQLHRVFAGLERWSAPIDRLAHAALAATGVILTAVALR